MAESKEVAEVTVKKERYKLPPRPRPPRPANRLDSKKLSAAFWNTLKKEWQEGANSESLAKKYPVSPQAIRQRMAGWVKLSTETGSMLWKNWLADCEKIFTSEFIFPGKYRRVVTPETLARIMGAIELGMGYRAAAQLEGVHYQTLKIWRLQCPALDELALRAARTFHEKNMLRIDKVAVHDWHAAKFMLETNETTRDEVRPASEESKLVIEFAFKRDELADEDETLIDNVDYKRIDPQDSDDGHS